MIRGCLVGLFDRGLLVQTRGENAFHDTIGLYDGEKLVNQKKKMP